MAGARTLGPWAAANIQSVGSGIRNPDRPHRAKPWCSCKRVVERESVLFRRSLDHARSGCPGSAAGCVVRAALHLSHFTLRLSPKLRVILPDDPSPPPSSSRMRQKTGHQSPTWVNDGSAAAGTINEPRDEPGGDTKEHCHDHPNDSRLPCRHDPPSAPGSRPGAHHSPPSDVRPRPRHHGHDRHHTSCSVASPRTAPASP